MFNSYLLLYGMHAMCHDSSVTFGKSESFVFIVYFWLTRRNRKRNLKKRKKCHEKYCTFEARSKGTEKKNERSRVKWVEKKMNPPEPQKVWNKMKRHWDIRPSKFFSWMKFSGLKVMLRPRGLSSHFTQLEKMLR